VHFVRSAWAVTADFEKCGITEELKAWLYRLRIGEPGVVAVD
jgi:hypothetical protein